VFDDHSRMRLQDLGSILRLRVKGIGGPTDVERRSIWSVLDSNGFNVWDVGVSHLLRPLEAADRDLSGDFDSKALDF